MNELLLKKYIDKLTTEHIINYAKKRGVELKNNESEIIYDYIKKYWKELYYNNDNSDIFKDLKCKLSFSTYEKLEQLYNETKESINKKHQLF